MDRKKMDRDVTYCTYCPKLCRFACPVTTATGKESHTPTAKQTLLYLVQQGTISLDQEIASAFYQCTGCKLCNEYCTHDISVWKAMWQARVQAVDRGIILDQTRELAKTFSRYGNPYGNLKEVAERVWDVWPHPDNPAQMVVFPGSATMALAPGLVESWGRVLKALGIAASLVSPPDMDSGSSLWAAGLSREFGARAAQVSNSMGGVTRILCLDPHDLSVLDEAPEYENLRHRRTYMAPIQFLEEILAQHKGPITKQPGTFVYHDPCHLSRHKRLSNRTRKLLQSLLEHPLRNAAWEGEDGRCCGGGGAYPQFYPEVSQIMAQRRLDDLAEAEAKELVTACPQCKNQFSLAGRESLDLVDLVERALGLQPQPEDRRQQNLPPEPAQDAPQGA